MLRDTSQAKSCITNLALHYILTHWNSLNIICAPVKTMATPLPLNNSRCQYNFRTKEPSLPRPHTPAHSRTYTRTCPPSRRYYTDAPGAVWCEVHLRDDSDLASSPVHLSLNHRNSTPDVETFEGHATRHRWAKCSERSDLWLTENS